MSGQGAAPVATAAPAAADPAMKAPDDMDRDEVKAALTTLQVEFNANCVTKTLVNLLKNTLAEKRREEVSGNISKQMADGDTAAPPAAAPPAAHERSATAPDRGRLPDPVSGDRFVGLVPTRPAQAVPKTGFRETSPEFEGFETLP